MRLDPLFRPESIAVIGASEKPTPGRRIIASLERIGFAGRIFPVNPNYPSVLNRPCYASPAELPEAPDIVVFCLGHDRVFSAFEAAAKRGMKAAVIYDGGFAEQGAEGRTLQARIAAICVEVGIALCGPNCMDILNPHHKSTTYLQELREPAGLAGNVAILSHSGGLCVGLLTDTRRFGFSHIVSSGNEATVSAAAFLEYLLEDPHTAIDPRCRGRNRYRAAAAVARAEGRDRGRDRFRHRRRQPARRLGQRHLRGQSAAGAETIRCQPGTRCDRLCARQFRRPAIRRAGNRPQLYRHVRRGGAPEREAAYLLTTRPGVMDRAFVGVLREHGVAAVGGFREGLMAIDRLARNAK
jgi:predicted CoA-binding protein